MRQIQPLQRLQVSDGLRHRGPRVVRQIQRHKRLQVSDGGRQRGQRVMRQIQPLQRLQVSDGLTTNLLTWFLAQSTTSGSVHGSCVSSQGRCAARNMSRKAASSSGGGVACTGNGMLVPVYSQSQRHHIVSEDCFSNSVFCKTGLERKCWLLMVHMAICMPLEFVWLYGL